MMQKEELISWFVNLSYVDMLSLYEGREQLGVHDPQPKHEPGNKDCPCIECCMEGNY